MGERPLVMAAAAAAVLAGPALGAPPPASAFGRLPMVQDAAISPDGRRIAILGGEDDERVLSIVPVDGRAGVTVDVGRGEARTVRWAGNGYVLVRTSTVERWADAGTGGRYVSHRDRDVVVDAAGARVTGQLLTGNPASGRATVLPILHILPEPRPAAVVLGLEEVLATGPGSFRIGRRSDSVEWVLWRAELPSGAGRVLERGAADTTGWDVDRSGEGRVRFDDDDAHRRHLILTRAKTATGWKVFAKARDKEGLPGYLGYSDPEDAIYLTRKGAWGTVQVVSRRLADGATRLVATLPASEPKLVVDAHTLSPVALRYQIDRPVYHWLDPQLQALSEKLQLAFPGRAFRFADWSSDRRRLLVEAAAPDAPPAWFLVDADRAEVSPVADSYPELKGAALGVTRWISYRARDGLLVHAYLTLPPGVRDGPPPLIVLPHGGPASRDQYGFDWWVQFLASRGYAVLQPQFRGSAGFGKAFEQAGRREWGGKMQTDLLDAIEDVASRGLADPKRVCIVGASFGGYAALAGATLHPDAYRCAVSVNGVSDLQLLLSETAHSYGPDSALLAYWKKQLGSPRISPAFLQSISPARQADKAKAAILLIAASDDSTVPWEQSTTMLAALHAAGKRAQLVTLENEDHYLSTPKGRTRMLEALEAFLARNLPVDAPAQVRNESGPASAHPRA